MEHNTHNQSVPKRKRFFGLKRWTRAEEWELIEFLMENRNFEKPTARLYYERIARGLALEWNTVRDKVRTMRTRYNKAKKFEASAGVVNIEGLQKLFRYVNEFDDIFGGRGYNFTYSPQQGSVEYTDMNSSSFKVEEENEMKMHMEIIVGIDPEDENISELAIKAEVANEPEFEIKQEFGINEQMRHATKDESPPQNKAKPRNKRMEVNSSTPMSDILRAHQESIDLKKMKMRRDAQFKKRELSLKEKELEMRQKELKLKERERRARFKLEMQKISAINQLYLNNFSI